ncbi:glycosyltransferase family 2 protein [Schaalia sp. 19OD2882]|uniref:glycosyltransferase family 2 protein n=1 Tax=Schaalia sp. 19OD2882 TaxID=2794089 RepID=UPI001C1EFE54|nr:glycosyltransferase [Schaalia sp. 19OD2882]QWW20296.1 glycosyltransferase family 2 protein [Schaalia sp. 19OD2882]
MTRRGTAAILVTRGATPDLERILRSLDSQTRRPDAVLVIDVHTRSRPGAPTLAQVDPRRLPCEATVVRVRAANLGRAIAAASATQGAAPILEGAQWWWILHEDTLPEPDCLDELLRVAESSRTVAAVGPKQVSWDQGDFLELGVRATSSARRVDHLLPGEIDQGQYDATTDVLAVGTAGMLLDAAAFDQVGGFDPALGPFADGLELGRRLHLAGRRVLVAPAARLRHRRDSLGSTPAELDASFRARRLAQTYTWAASTPWWALPWVALALALIAPARAVARLAMGTPGLAWAEISAWLALVARTHRIVAARFRNARVRTVPRSTLKGLETPAATIREMRRLARAQEREEAQAGQDARAAADRRRGRLRAAADAGLLAGGLLALSLLWRLRPDAVPHQGTPAQLPARWTDLWAAAWSSWLPAGDGHAAAPDPSTVLMALVSAPGGALGVAPDQTMRMLLLVAMPAAGIAAWTLAGVFTCARLPRVLAGLTWAGLAPLTAALVEGLLVPAMAHVAAPVLALAWIRMLTPDDVKLLAAPPRPRKGHAGLAALAATVLVTAQPALLLALAAGLAALAPLLRRRTGAALLTLVPAGVLVAPHVFDSLATAGSRIALLTTTGPAPRTVPAPPWQSLLLLPTWIEWTPLRWAEAGLTLLLVLAVLVRAASALVPSCRANATARPVARAQALALGAVPVLLVPAVLLRLLPVAIVEATPVSAWPGIWQSLAGLALLLVLLAPAGPPPADATTAPARRLPERLRRCVGLGAGLVVLASLAVPVAGQVASVGADASSSGRPTTTPTRVPAVSEQAQTSTRAGRLLVLSAGRAADLQVELLRGPGQDWLTSTPALRALHSTGGSAGDRAMDDLAEASWTLVTQPDRATVDALAAHGVDTILLPTGKSPSTWQDALGRAPGLERIGVTELGDLWRLRIDGRAPARVELVTDDAVSALDATQLRVDTQVVGPGTLRLAERADNGWRANLDGKPLQVVSGGESAWSQAFTVPGPGHLVVTHDAWWTLPWKIACILALILTLLASIPVRRRR